MAKAKAPETAPEQEEAPVEATPEQSVDNQVETINLGEFIDRLGLNQPAWVKRPELREWLNQQEGVQFLSRKSFIPANLVEVMRTEFDVQPVQKRTRKARASKSQDNTTRYNQMTVEALVNARQELRSLVEDDHDGSEAELEEARTRLAELEDKAQRVKDASKNLHLVEQELISRKDALEAEEARIAEQRKMLADLSK